MKYVTDATEVVWLLLAIVLLAVVIKVFFLDKKKL